MKVKIISRCKTNNKIYVRGDVETFDDVLAKELVEKNLAIPMGGPPRKEKDDKKHKDE